MIVAEQFGLVGFMRAYEIACRPGRQTKDSTDDLKVYAVQGRREKMYNISRTK
ncbi:MAG TPA: hypothetical protein VH796_15240 [Nitrososphaeraceae archaeon]